MTKKEIVINEYFKNPDFNRTHLAKQIGLTREHVIRIIRNINHKSTKLHSSLMFEQEMELILRMFPAGSEFPIKFPDCEIKVLVKEIGVFSFSTFDSFNKEMVYIRNIYIKFSSTENTDLLRSAMQM